MSTGTANFYRLRGSFSTGEYPLIPSGADLTPYRIHTASVKYAAGIQTTITIPEFSSYQDVNVIEIDDNFYWATAWQESTTFNGSITYLCDYMAPTSLLRSGQTVNAYLNRSPTYITRYLSDDWTKGRLVLSDLQELGKKLIGASSEPIFWVQITGVDSNGDFRRFGLFATVNVSDEAFAEPNLAISLPSPHSGSVGYYPSLLDVMSNIVDFTPLTADSVKDISISRRAPYDYFNKKVEVGLQTYYCPVLGNSGATIPTYIEATQNGGGTLLTYDMDSIMSNLDLLQVTDSWTFDDTDELRMTGSILIRDYNMNIVGSFPADEGLTITATTYCDYSGIYTIISNDYRRITIPEGHLPWAGSGWDEYRAYQLAGDRQAMENAIGYAERERFNTSLSGLGEGVVSGALTGALAGTVGGPLGAGIGLITGGISSIATTLGARVDYDIEAGKLRDEQALRELRAKTSMGSGYNVAYGLIYVALTVMDNDLCAGIEAPLEDDDLLQEYVDRTGYPCEGLHQIAITEGFYKGYIPIGSLGEGMFFNELNRIMRQGFRFIDLDPPVPQKVTLNEWSEDYVIRIDGDSTPYHVSDFENMIADGLGYELDFDHNETIFGSSWLASHPYITYTTSSDLPSSNHVVGITIFTGTATKDLNENYGYLIMKNKVYAFTTAPNYMHDISSSDLAETIKATVFMHPYNNKLTNALMTNTFQITEVKE